ncbi:hypothetical protein HY967_03050, partial [Candidatus Jorgensenbacteria bacterium]|nr:hypothetical protein [Candidatus Jorgensenbacteria bacterium]
KSSLKGFSFPFKLFKTETASKEGERPVKARVEMPVNKDTDRKVHYSEHRTPLESFGENNVIDLERFAPTTTPEPTKEPPKIEIKTPTKNLAPFKPIFSTDNLEPKQPIQTPNIQSKSSTQINEPVHKPSFFGFNKQKTQPPATSKPSQQDPKQEETKGPTLEGNTVNLR